MVRLRLKARRSVRREDTQSKGVAIVDRLERSVGRLVALADEVLSETWLPAPVLHSMQELQRRKEELLIKERRLEELQRTLDGEARDQQARDRRLRRQRARLSRLEGDLNRERRRHRASGTSKVKELEAALASRDMYIRDVLSYHAQPPVLTRPW
jgi:septal ring factor EnvC (AmiA/AmiB activator)